MTEEVLIKAAHVVLAIAALGFAVWSLIKVNDCGVRYDVIGVLGFLFLALGSVFIAIMAILLAFL